MIQSVSESPERYRAAGEDVEIVMANAAEDTVRELMRLRDAERRATKWMIRLTVVIAIATIVLVALTYGLVANALQWWPFG
jgi:hypothetical protein